MDARKKWLKYFLLGIGCGLAYLLFLTFTDPEITPTVAIVSSLFLLGISWIPYHCAYRRPGTIMLLWQIILSYFSIATMTVGLAATLVTFAFSLYKGKLSTFAELVGQPIPTLIGCLLTCAYVYYLILYIRACRDLRRLNKSIKATPSSQPGG